MSAHSGNKRHRDNLIVLAERRPLQSSGIANTIIASTGNPTPAAQVTFDRKELNAILNLYSFRVADGEWRDYAIDHLPDRAVFSVYRKASERALFAIVKDPKLARKQGAYSVIADTGKVLKRGHELRQVLKVFDRRLKLVE
ncbi:DUF2794 domain-containing protein [Pseudahrensia aquimaris]|uniref:DUF2794 domain-containing protein n=1 Tax=Pseudahrensia aquimaris TaxID=744461 RepID=A0ABW3FIE6_9HYPH